MDSLDQNVFTFYKNKKKEKWWSVILPFKDTEKNVTAVKETCKLFMNKLKKEPICIGEGCYGQAWIVKMDGKQKEFVQKIYVEIEDTVEIITEVNVLTCCDSEYIPKLIYSGFVYEETIVNKKKEEIIKWCTIMEYFKGGTLWYHIKKDNKITPDGAKFIAFELALALKYLHGKNYTHGDLKPDNIVLTENGNVRLIDFGKSRNVKTNGILPGQNKWYMAPEVFRGDSAGVASDRWSYAVVLCFLIQGEAPFGKDGQNGKEIYDAAISKEPKMNNINDANAKDLIRKLLNPDPVQRYSEITKHAYFKGLKKDDDPPFKPGVLDLKHIDVIDGVEGSVNIDWLVYVDLVGEALKIPTISNFESLEKPTIVNKETKNLPTHVKSKKLLNVKETNIQVNELTKSKGMEDVTKFKGNKIEISKTNAAKKVPDDGEGKKLNVVRKVAKTKDNGEVKKPEDVIKMPIPERKATNKKGGDKGKKQKASEKGRKKAK